MGVVIKVFRMEKYKSDERLKCRHSEPLLTVTLTGCHKTNLGRLVFLPKDCFLVKISFLSETIFGEQVGKVCV